MRAIFIFLPAMLLFSEIANAAQDCGGNPPVRVWPDKSLLQVGNVTYQMRKENIRKRLYRLIGNNIVFIQQQKAATLIRNGSHSKYTCIKGRDDADPGPIQPYVANIFIPSSDESVSSSDYGNSDGSKSKGKGKGGGGGRGRGGGGGGGGGGHGGHGKNK